jgi:hypothetical protein
MCKVTAKGANAGALGLQRRIVGSTPVVVESVEDKALGAENNSGSGVDGLAIR